MNAIEKELGKELRASPQWKRAVARYQGNPSERNYKVLERLFWKDTKLRNYLIKRQVDRIYSQANTTSAQVRRAQ